MLSIGIKISRQKKKIFQGSLDSNFYNFWRQIWINIESMSDDMDFWKVKDH
jgi:hypothetical protein